MSVSPSSGHRLSTDGPEPVVYVPHPSPSFPVRDPYARPRSTRETLVSLVAPSSSLRTSLVYGTLEALPARTGTEGSCYRSDDACTVSLHVIRLHLSGSPRIHTTVVLSGSRLAPEPGRDRRSSPSWCPRPWPGAPVLESRKIRPQHRHTPGPWVVGDRSGGSGHRCTSFVRQVDSVSLLLASS